VIVHPLEKLSGQSVSRSLGNHGIDSALGAQRGLFLINPSCDLAWLINGEAIETAAEITARQLVSIVATMAVRTKGILVESGDRKAKFEHAVTLVDWDNRG
jgi:hypothetical protein